MFGRSVRGTRMPSVQDLITLTLHPTVTALLPFMATAFPAEGAVPSGQTIVSPDAASLDASILSTWADSSAKVVVLAGEKSVTNGVTAAVALRSGSPSGATALTTAVITSAISSISVNFGGGAQTISNFSSPDRTWWANSQVICARYRLSCGLGTMEAVIDVHAFAGGRAFVEVVIENAKVDAGLATVTGPSTQTYTSATVAVNGSTIATVSSPSASMAFPNSRRSGTYAGGHQPFRAWYCSTWVGGDPGIEVTHDTTSMRAHPLFFRPAEESTEAFSTKYAQSYDTYAPWALCRLRIPNMADTGDDEQIGLYTEEQTDYVLFGSKYARRAVLATGQACLSANINWRHTDGTVPTQAQISGKNTSNGDWPASAVEPGWGGPTQTNDGSHIPVVGLVPFLCRPSPCFIEIAQKEYAWNATNFNSLDGSHPYDQMRGRAWRARNYGATIFLTPDSDSTRKSGYRAALVLQADIPKQMLDKAFNTLGALWDLEVASNMTDHSGSRAGFQTTFFQMEFIALAYHAIAGAKVLTGSDQTNFATIADRVAAFAVRWINDASSFEWRAIPYQPTIGTLSAPTIDMTPGNWQSITKAEMSGTVPNAPGKWMPFLPSDFNYDTLVGEDSAGITYPSWFWASLCAAVERNITGASSAWTTVVTNGGINNLATWRQGFRTSPRFNRYPRNR